MTELAERIDRDARDRGGSEPRAVVHKNILDRAAADPDVPMSVIATDVPGATVDIVERVLEEYGDPGAADDQTEEQSDEMPEADHDSTTDSEPMGEQTWDARQSTVPEVGSLTEKQRQTLGTIQDHPEATQAELAELLGVTSATINTRVNAIDGFEWDRRHEFVDRLFDDERVERNDRNEGDDADRSDDANELNGEDRPASVARDADGSSDDGDSPTDELADRIDELAARMESFAECVEERKRQPAGLVDDPELVHKILRACLNDDDISPDEELEIVRAVVG